MAALRAILGLAVLSLLASVSGQTCRCADELMHNGMGYLYCNCHMTWYAANDYCAASYHGQLALIRDAGLQDLLQVHLLDNSAHDTWIGARGDVVDWHWIHGNKNIGYQGCFQDDPLNRDLSLDVRLDVGVTPEICIAECKSKYKYAGLQAGSQCFCGNSFGQHGFSDDCSNPCSGDFNLNCGGPLSNNVYRIDGVWSGGWVFGAPSSGSSGFDDQECMVYKCERFFGWSWQNAKCERRFRYLCMYDYDNSTCIARGLTPTAETCIGYEGTKAVSWFDAVLKCQDLGGRLLKMTSALSHWAIRDALKDQCQLNTLWIGATKVNWTLANGEALRYTNWAASRPSSNGDKCVAMSYKLSDKYEWSDLGCDKTQAFICERPAGVIIPTTTTTSTTTTTTQPTTTTTTSTTTTTPTTTTTRSTTTTRPTTTTTIPTTTTTKATTTSTPLPTTTTTITSSVKYTEPSTKVTQYPPSTASSLEPGFPDVSSPTPTKAKPSTTSGPITNVTMEPQDPSSHVDWIPIYIGIAVAAVVVILILVCLIYTCRKRCASSSDKKATMRVENGYSNRAGFVHDGDFAYKTPATKNGGFPDRITDRPPYVAVTPNNHAPPISIVPPVSLDMKDSEIPDNITSTVTSATSSEPRDEATSDSSSVSSSSSVYIGELEDQGVGVKYVHPRDEEPRDATPEVVRNETPEIVNQPTLPKERVFHSRGPAPSPPTKGRAPAPPENINVSTIDISTRL